MDLIGKTFRVQVADGDAQYEVVEQKDFIPSKMDDAEVEFVLVRWDERNGQDYQGIFGDEAWVEARVIAPLVEHYERYYA
jgi:hypothetical protein